MSEATPENEPFDEEFYLRSNPDVADAVKYGRYASGLAHFLLHGRGEGRAGTTLEMLARVSSANDAGRRYARQDEWRSVQAGPAGESRPNALRVFFENRRQGRGIWKWQHYFDIYERHLGRFRNREIHVLDIGIYSGGSLEMWREYFGPRARIYGVDIEPACKRYEGGSSRSIPFTSRIRWTDPGPVTTALAVRIAVGAQRQERLLARAGSEIPRAI